MILTNLLKRIIRKLVWIAAPVCTSISPMLNTKLLYFYSFRRKLDMNNPITLNDKILWLKFNTYWNNPIIKQCADKYEVRRYLEEKGLSDLLVKMISSYDSPDQIKWDDLPSSFAMKLNVGCGMNLIVSDKSTLNIKDTALMLNKWMKEEYWRDFSEMQYKDVKKEL